MTVPNNTTPIRAPSVSDGSPNPALAHVVRKSRQNPALALGARIGAKIRRAFPRFWLDVLFWWTEHCPFVVLVSRRFWAWSGWRFSRLMREGTLANARRILGPNADDTECVTLAKSVIRNFYTSVYELGRSVRLSQSELVAQIDGVDGRDIYRAARKSGKGAIVVTAHLGAFELGVAALTQEEKRIHVVFQRDAVPRFDRLRSELRRRLGVVEAAVDEGWSMWPRLVDALGADEVVVIQADRVMPGQRGEPVPFFGGHILMPTGPLKLALASGAPVIPIFSIRTALGRVRIVVEEAITVSREQGPLTGRHPAMLALASAIERHVRAHPDQWLMVYPMWCEDLNPKDVARRPTAVKTG